MTQTLKVEEVRKVSSEGQRVESQNREGERRRNTFSSELRKISKRRRRRSRLCFFLSFQESLVQWEVISGSGSGRSFAVRQT